ncbi:MAG: NPCBM/NEW2 domain-containing protein, partial [Lentisphaeraceae bacterium]|nr:NPCBM/NEW2 domain-containing protein [Lentisphaeraceae bacterium]
DHAGWLNARVENDENDYLELKDLKWEMGKSLWGVTAVGKNANGDKLRYRHKVYPHGLGTHALSIIEYNIPPGYRYFKALGVISDSGSKQPAGRSSIIFEVYTKFPEGRFRSLILGKSDAEMIKESKRQKKKEFLRGAK